MSDRPERRTLDFRDLDAVLRDLDLLASGYDRAGNWNLAQVCGHLAEWMRFPIDGFPRPALPIRMILWFMRITVGKRMLNEILAKRSMPRGRPTLRETVPASTGNDAAAIEQLRQVIARFRAHTGPFQPSPAFGDMDRETCTQLQLIHCSHHLSFLVPRGRSA